MSMQLFYIRPYQLSDAPAILAALQESAHISVWLPDIKADPAVIRAYLKNQPEVWAAGDGYNFAIVDFQDHTLAGGCGLTQLNRRHRFANIYYWVRASRLRQGVASTAVLRLASFGFEQLGLERVEIVVPVDNLASIRVAEKCGATREGRLRHRVRLHDQMHDAWLYSLIPADLAAA